MATAAARVWHPRRGAPGVGDNEGAVPNGRKPLQPEAMLGGDEPAFGFMRGRRGRHEVDQVEVHRLAIFLGRAQMAEMNRVEASAEKTYSHDVPVLLNFRSVPGHCRESRICR